jgi:hypothetical protein
MRIPEWAPWDLVELWNKRDEPRGEFQLNPVIPSFDSRIDRAEELDALRKMIFDPRMEKVWLTIVKLNEQKLDGELNGRCGWHFFIVQCCIREFSQMPRHTPAERAAHLESIARAADELANRLYDSYYMCATDPTSLLNGDELGQLSDALSFIGTWDDKRDEFQCIAAENMPPVWAMVGRVAELARVIAQTPPRVKHQKDPDEARCHYFVRELSREFRRAYGRPLHGTVARFASVLLDDDITEDRVRMLTTDVGLSFDDIERARNHTFQAGARKTEAN